MEQSLNNVNEQEQTVSDSELEGIETALDNEYETDGKESASALGEKRERILIDGVEYYGMESSFSEKEFLRSVCMDFVTSPDAPVDIFDSEFSEPEASCAEFVVTETQANVEYTCSIGYNRWEKERVWSESRKAYYEKSKLVTDWQPYSGKQSGVYVACAKNDDEENATDKKMAEKITSEFKNGTLVPALDEGLSTEKLDIKPSCKKSLNKKINASLISDIRKTTPGDTTKNISGTPMLKRRRLASVRIPKWSVEYKYKGESFKRVTLANEEYKGEGAFPKKEKLDTRYDLSKKCGKNMTLTVIAGLIIAMSLIAAVFTLIVKHTDYMALIALVILFWAGAIGFVVWYIKKRKDFLSPIIEKAMSELREKFVNMFKRLELDEPTEEEKRVFEEKVKDKIPTADVMLCLMIIFSVISVILAIAI